MYPATPAFEIRMNRELSRKIYVRVIPFPEVIVFGTPETRDIRV